ncbi:MAG TPA: hypothetical protein VFI70_11920 [Nitrososphaeraceae archaeon]|nr:hypothetical protein [Nitrososphaeraceae archaeon]
MGILLSEIQRSIGRTMMMIITVPTLLYAITTILLISASVITFTYYYLSPIRAYSQIEPFPPNPLYKSVVSDNSSGQQQQIHQLPQSKVIEASGHFANNQIENDSVSWIQGGLWHLVVYNSSSSLSSTPNSNTGAKAIFSGNFTMVKPDGSQTHEHSVSDFRSNNVIIAGGDMVITGLGNIYENTVLKYRQVPITVHLMGKEHVLGLIIDTVKTNRHFVSNHEMFGTLIKGTGLEKIEKTLVSSPPQQQKNSKSMNMNRMAM